MNRALIFICAMLSGACCFAQKARKIEVKGANSLEFDSRLSGAQRLIGNVVFEHEGALLYCDSAYLYEESNQLEAFSNVRIVSDSVTVRGDHLNYQGNKKLAHITGKPVVLTDPSAVLTSDQLLFNTETNVASYTTGGKIVSSKNKNELSSSTGYYYSADKVVYFRKNVVLTNPEYTMTCDTLKYSTATEVAWFFGPTWIKSKENRIYCENGYYNTRTEVSEFGVNAALHSKGQSISADWLWYDRNKETGKARKNVVIRDTSEKLVLRGHFADYFEADEHIVLTDSAVMEKEFSRDTLFLHGDTLRSVTDTATGMRQMAVYRNVKFFKRDFQGKCDSLAYTEVDSLMRLFGNPIIWNGENQLTADSIRLQLAGDQLSELIMRNSSFIISIEDSLHYNQIRGKHINGYFRDGELSKIVVRGNGQSVYYVQSDDDDSYIGVNKADCSDMMIYLDSSAVSKITFITQPDAIFYPVNELSGTELQLKGFRWLQMHRPLKPRDIFVRIKEPEATTSKRSRIQ